MGFNSGFKGLTSLRDGHIRGIPPLNFATLADGFSGFPQ